MTSVITGGITGGMGQHYLLSRDAFTLSLEDIFQLSEAEARDVFSKARWPDTNGEPVCPICACSAVYALRNTPKKKREGWWKCQRCAKQFSVTSGTTFHSRKLSCRKMLAILLIYISSSKGMNAIELRVLFKNAHKTMFVLSSKVREVLAKEPEDLSLGGDIEIDGVYIGGIIRKRNYAEDRADRRKIRNGKRRVVVTIKVRYGKSYPFVFRYEADALETIYKFVNPNLANIFADEAAHWDELPMWYVTYRICHKECYSDGTAHTNFVESFNGSIRYTERGAYRRISGPYLLNYARDVAFRVDNNKTPNEYKFQTLLGMCLNSPKSVSWTGYWGKRKKRKPKEWWKHDIST